jgi:hypothetical protein
VEVGRVSSLIWFLGGADSPSVSHQYGVLGFRYKGGGDQQLSLDFPLRLALNKWYVLALAPALVVSFLGYAVLGRFSITHSPAQAREAK